MRKVHLLIAIFACFVCLLDTSCKKNNVIQQNPTPQPPTNLPPIARAGSDITIILPVSTVSLDGSGSIDPDGNIIGYSWSKISGPASFSIGNANAVRTQLTSLIEGAYLFELTVSDAGALIGKDTIQITVFNPTVTVPCDNRPIINATLVPIGNLSQARAGMLYASAGNKILFAGGYGPGGSSRVDIYDISTNSWSIAELSQEWFGTRWDMTAASVGNKVFFAGGGEPIDGYGSARVDIYDASFNTWSSTNLTVGRMNMAAVAAGNKVFFAGGGYTHYSSPFDWINSNVVDIYDNSSNTWTTALLSEGRSGLSATSSGNKVFFAGGSYFSGQTINVSDKIDIYDLATNSWSTSNMQEPRSQMGSIAAGNKIFWSGGLKSFSNTGTITNNNIEIRDLSTGTSSFVCLNPRESSPSVIKGDNIVFFTGYSLGNNNIFEIYNITSGTWSTGVLSQQLTDAAIISVNNTIYVAGGSLNGNYTDKVWKLEF